ncbi:MAG: seryl-tRNA synthetase [Candidatus Saccharibacteria bacterium]|nr:seryl-tRNA synthetase [Candidatus Saccharibacteria bacterium]
MLDIRFIRENPELVRDHAQKKGYTVDIDELLRLDEQRRGQQQQADALRERRNALSSQLKAQPEPAVIEEVKALKEELSTFEAALAESDDVYFELMQSIPNTMQDGVPVGGEEDSVEIKKWGEQHTGAIDHLDFALKRHWVDFERGAKVAGAKFYYLKGDLALLENAITQFALDFVIKKGFTYMTVPHMVNTRVARGAGFAPRGDLESNEYFIEGDDLTLIGTAEAPLTGYHADEIINEANLPLLYVGYSPSYRKEAGTYGKHNRGLFRVHQFNKLEMYAFTTPEQSAEMHERILGIEEEIWQAIGIPYHVINIASGDLGAPASKKYDIEYWSPVDTIYRELTSASNCTDFQARNLNIRVRGEDGTVRTLHTLNGTAVSLARSMVAIIEHYQNDDGTLRVPEVLRPYLSGRDVL